MRSSFILLLLTAQQFTTGAARLGDATLAAVDNMNPTGHLRRRTTSYVDDEETTKTVAEYEFLRRRNAASSEVEPPHRYYTDVAEDVAEDDGLHDGAEGHMRRMRDVPRDSLAFDTYSYANKDMTGRNKRLSRGI